MNACGHVSVGETNVSLSHTHASQNKQTNKQTRVLDDAVEIDAKKQERKEVGRILLKGESITLLQAAQPVRETQQ